MAAQVRVLEQTRVAPPPSTPSAILPITFFDAAWLFTGPVERLFFYRHPDPASALPLLTSSLPHALRRFYPLAGNLNPSKEPFNYTYSRGDDALTFVVAESRTPGDFDRLVGTGPRDLREMHPLVPRLPRPRPLPRRLRPPCRLRRRLRNALRPDLGRRVPPRR